MINYMIFMGKDELRGGGGNTVLNLVQDYNT